MEFFVYVKKVSISGFQLLVNTESRTPDGYSYLGVVSARNHDEAMQETWKRLIGKF